MANRNHRQVYELKCDHFFFRCSHSVICSTFVNLYHLPFPFVCVRVLICVERVISGSFSFAHSHVHKNFNFRFRFLFNFYLCSINQATDNPKVKNRISLELSFVNSNLQLLKEKLSELNASVEIYQNDSQEVLMPFIPIGLKETVDINFMDTFSERVSANPCYLKKKKKKHFYFFAVYS